MRMILLAAGATVLIFLLPHGQDPEGNARSAAHLNIDSESGRATISLTASLSWEA